MAKILVIQHVPHEGLGNIETELKLAGHTTETIAVWDHPVFPSSTKLEDYGGIIVLGGPMAVYEESQHPWMTKELLVIGEALRQKKPFLGICLGAQLLAKAAGADVYPGNREDRPTEIGWYPIRLDDWFYKRNPLFFQIDPAKEHTVFQWHGDTFDIPTEGYRLALSENYPNQAFCFQGNAVGLQFHVEMTEELIRSWVTGDENRAKILSQGCDPDEILADMPKHLPGLQALCHKICYGFVSLIRTNTRRAA